MFGILGLGLQGAGLITNMIGAGRATQSQKQIAEYERQIEAQKMRAMELDAKRRTIEIMRTGQRAQAMALTAASAQGAQYGSGLQGGYAQVAGQTNFNALGVQQNLEIGRNIFDLNSKISDEKMNLFDAQGLMNIGQGLMGMGGALVGAQDKLGNLAGNFNTTTQRQGTFNTGYNGWRGLY